MSGVRKTKAKTKTNILSRFYRTNIWERKKAVLGFVDLEKSSDRALRESVRQAMRKQEVVKWLL